MKSVFTVAYRGTFGEFMGLYRVGDEKRVRWGKSLFIEAISNVDPAQRYPMCEFLLDRECVLDAGTKDGTNRACSIVCVSVFCLKGLMHDE